MRRKSGANFVASRMGKIALFIDGANTHAAGRALGFDLDFKRVLLEFVEQGSTGSRFLLHDHF
jgi:hypothetical protein